jgi:hypothetical protein
VKVLVCGGRHYSDRRYMERVLLKIHVRTPIRLLVEGGSGGADFHAGQWADSMGIEHVIVFADWDIHGLAAGPIRNKQMLTEYHPNLVIAFPGGKGTANMIQQAKAYGVLVRQV